VEFEASPISAFLEAAATAVGVGMVLGGFAAGLAAVLRGSGREKLESRALDAGYAFAAVCLAVRLAELASSV
jgi:hypothetical protein